MPGANLTRIEAEERKSVIAAPVHYTVKLDLTRGAKNFGSETTITFDAEPGATSFLDLIATEVSEIVLNGETLDPAEAFADSRIELKNLEAHNEVTVKALCQYSNTGEGLHRSVDPSDGNIYLYSQFEVPDAAACMPCSTSPTSRPCSIFPCLQPSRGSSPPTCLPHP